MAEILANTDINIWTAISYLADILVWNWAVAGDSVLSLRCCGADC